MRRTAARLPRVRARRDRAPHRNAFPKTARQWRRINAVRVELPADQWFFRSPVDLRSLRFLAAADERGAHMLLSRGYTGAPSARDGLRRRIWEHLRFGFRGAPLSGKDLTPSQTRDAILRALGPYRRLALHSRSLADWLDISALYGRFWSWHGVAASGARMAPNAKLLVAWFGRRLGYLLGDPYKV